jgi:hypothetical protein
MQEESKDCKICSWVNVEDTWIELAHHILENKFTHKSGLKWAQTFQLKFAKYEIKKPEYEGRLPYTEEQKEARENCVRPVSGIESVVMCICPNCRQNFQFRLAKEYVEDDGVWKIGNNFAIVCEYCRRSKSKF